jgi:hypothetical protein
MRGQTTPRDGSSRGYASPWSPGGATVLGRQFSVFGVDTLGNQFVERRLLADSMPRGVVIRHFPKALNPFQIGHCDLPFQAQRLKPNIYV